MSPYDVLLTLKFRAQRNWANQISVKLNNNILSQPNNSRFPIEVLQSSENPNVTEFSFGGREFIYYFPYINGTGFPGFCIVPRDVEFGTLVTTGGMNGCKIRVILTDDYFIFIHDNNHQLDNPDKEIKLYNEIIKYIDINFDDYKKKLYISNNWITVNDYWLQNQDLPRYFQPVISIKGRNEIWCHFSAFSLLPNSVMPVPNENVLVCKILQ